MREDNSKPVIKWNKEKDGVEVKADGYHFVIANIPDISCNWYNTLYFCDKFNTYLPSIEELKVVAKYLDVINQCFKDNNGFPMEGSFYWSSSEYSSNYARRMFTGNGNVYGTNKNGYDFFRGFARL